MIDPKQHTKLSKFLSLVLRHRPEVIGLELDPQGWTSVSDLISKMNNAGRRIDLETLQLIVADNDKKRFAFSADGSKIRANQGHSIPVDLGYELVAPPDTLTSLQSSSARHQGTKMGEPG